MDLPDFVRDEVLKLPQVRVMDPDGLQSCHRLEQLLRARSGVAARAGKDRCNLLYRPFGPVRNIRGISIKAERPERTIIREQIDQPQRRIPVRAADFTLQKLDHQGVPIRAQRTLCDAGARPTAA